MMSEKSPMPPQCQGGSGCTCCGPDCDCGCVEKCPAYKRLSTVYVPPRNQGKTMMSEIQAGDGWRLLGPDEPVDGFGDEYGRLDGVWFKVPSYFTLRKASEFHAVRRHIPAKPESMEIDGYEVSLDNGFPRIASLLGTQKMYFSSRPKAIRQLIAWLQQVAEWREAQGDSK